MVEIKNKNELYSKLIEYGKVIKLEKLGLRKRRIALDGLSIAQYRGEKPTKLNGVNGVEFRLIKHKNIIKYYNEILLVI